MTDTQRRDDLEAELRKIIEVQERRAIRAEDERDQFRAKAEQEYQLRVAAHAALAWLRARVEALCKQAEHTNGGGIVLSDELRGALATPTDPWGAAGECCALHIDGPDHDNGMAACCDLADCGPCCENCPTCPTLARHGTEEADV